MAQKCRLKSCYYGNGCLPLIMIIEANMVAAVSMVIWIDPNYFVKGIINNKQTNWTMGIRGCEAQSNNVKSQQEC